MNDIYNELDGVQSPKPPKESKTFDKKAWGERKQAEKQIAYETIDNMVNEIKGDVDRFKEYLNTQSRLDKYSVANTLLIMAQCPNATQLKDYDSWKEAGSSVRQAQVGMIILEPAGEYVRDDGSTAVSYNTKKVFDVSQTFGKEKAKPQVNRDERIVMKALIQNPIVPIKAVDTLPSEKMGACYDDKEKTIFVRRGLRLALILAFSCSLRMGEMLGLTWDCIDVTDNSIKNESSNVYVNKELQRVSRSAMVDLSNRDVVKQFPSILGSQSTCLVLKAPKTKSSVRRIYLPPTVAYLLQERKQDIENLKELLGDEYKDYNLVFCNNSGSPIEGQIINRALNKLIEENSLPKVVFHSLRHSSITYKLKLNGGDIKSVQGDSGHAQASMVTERYSHIIDEDRRFNAQRFEHAFFSGVELRNSKRPSFDNNEISSAKTAESAEIKENQSVQTAGVDSQNDLQQILALLQNKPELLTTLKTLANVL